MLPISVCIITKNEEAFLASCLEKLSRYDWEIIVTDTGSEDQTLAIAKGYAHQVHHFPWCNDFSAARNYCISQASHDWILNVDSDEYLLNTESPTQLMKALSSCLSHPETVGLVDILNPFSSTSGQSASLEPIGRFFHRQYHHYQGAIHEQPFSRSGKRVTYQKTPFRFHHEGYADPGVLRQKALRNINLLTQAIDQNPEDPYLYYQLGQSHFVLGDYEQACPVFQQGLTFDVDPNLQYVRTMVESYGHCLLSLKRYQEALSFEGIYEAFSSHADFVFLMGLIYMNNGLFSAAIEQFHLATTIGDHAVQGINSYLAYYNIGVIHECLGEPKKALHAYQQCGQYPPALEGIKRLKK